MMNASQRVEDLVSDGMGLPKMWLLWLSSMFVTGLFPLPCFMPHMQPAACGACVSCGFVTVLVLNCKEPSAQCRHIHFHSNIIAIGHFSGFVF